MKRILLSAGMIAVVGALAFGGTIAFYNDTETSSGNVFVAGAIDLKVDHTYASYNGEECVGVCTETGSNLILNDGFENPEPVANGGQWEVYPAGIPNWSVVSGAGIEIQEGGVAGAPHGGDQLVELDSHGSGSQTTMQQVINTVPGQKYRLKFWHSPRPANGPDTDNAIQLNILVTSTSGTIVNSTIGQPSFSGSGTVWTEYTYNFIALDTQTSIRFSDAGSHADTLGGYLDDVSVRELSCTPDTYQNGGICALWNEQDLGQGDIFWNFPDIKPGDHGTTTLSLHVYDNDAFVCLLPDNIVDDENTVVDPETTAGDGPTVGPTPLYGELSGELEFFMWKDVNGNNAFDLTEQVLLNAGTPFNQIQTELVQLSLTSPAPISLVGISWCAGDQTGPTTANSNISLACDGNGMGNIAQTDKMLADFVAYAEQQRNNEGFSCEAVDLENL
ncbi:MAG: hypothetical protein UW83_C0015G0010 [Parcubacteria group bacterium GW2011_GWD1_44_9]|nr:MAG: hypothetical protein UV94_C0008G0060 [Parcubacteria group bacterium GW2011_GWC1_43_30]KKT85527.1 MAG: hypothetical protein UW83_C0015G0010 [Parcubacteria group bacterium GW2011_GWD1_44_9]